MVAQQLMKNAEKHKYLHDDQHGGQNGCKTLGIVLSKTITFKTLSLQQANFGCTDCNAKACYNQIVLMVLMLAYFKAGLPYQCCVFLVTMIYSLQYALTTVFEETPFCNWHNYITAVFGIGQGATDGPAG
eukprot:8281936-Ditylum_brightwellii.AAC.1